MRILLLADTVAKVFLHRPTQIFRAVLRRSNNHLRDYVICDELTGGFGNGLEPTSIGDYSSIALFARNSSHGISGLLQQYLSTADLHKLPEGVRVDRDGRQRRDAPCGSVADHRGKHEIKGCRQFGAAPVGRLARRGGHKCVPRILKEGSTNGATALADEHQLAIGGLPLSEDWLSRREAARRIIRS
jgi:hypothetical protein